MLHRGVRSALPCGPPTNHGGNSTREGDYYLSFKEKIEDKPQKIKVKLGNSVSQGIEVIGLEPGFVRVFMPGT